MKQKAYVQRCGKTSWQIHQIYIENNFIKLHMKPAAKKYCFSIILYNAIFHNHITSKTRLWDLEIISHFPYLLFIKYLYHLVKLELYFKTFIEVNSIYPFYETVANYENQHTELQKKRKPTKLNFSLLIFANIS